jgi:hypothetical protein
MDNRDDTNRDLLIGLLAVQNGLVEQNVLFRAFRASGRAASRGRSPRCLPPRGRSTLASELCSKDSPSIRFVRAPYLGLESIVASRAALLIETGPEFLVSPTSRPSVRGGIPGCGRSCGN